MVFKNSRNCLPSIYHSLPRRPPPPFLRRYSEDLYDSVGVRDELFLAKPTVQRHAELSIWDIWTQERGALPFLRSQWDATLFCLKITRNTVLFLRSPAFETWGPFKVLVSKTVWLKREPCFSASCYFSLFHMF